MEFRSHIGELRTMERTWAKAKSPPHFSPAEIFILFTPYFSPLHYFTISPGGEVGAE